MVKQNKNFGDYSPRWRRRLLRAARRTGNPAQEPSDTQTQIARINELSKTARATWLSLLGYLAFVGVTLLAVEDVDFFDPSRQTQLPLINVAIPTASFFAFAPILGAALYIYLHLYLLKLWEVLSDIPAKVGEDPISDQLTPWLINDLVLGMRNNGALRERPMRRLSKCVTVALVFVAGPLVLAGFWWWSFPAHNQWLTLFIGLLMFLAWRSGYVSWQYLQERLGRRKKDRFTGIWGRVVWLYKNGLVALTAMFVFTTSWITTEGGVSGYFVPGTFAEDSIANLRPIVHANLSGQELTERPSEWRNFETAERRFRSEWCSRQGLESAICGQVYSKTKTPPAHIWPKRIAWCGESYKGEICKEHFAGLDDQFQVEWREERDSLLAELRKLNLIAADLRDANLESAFLPRADLRFARLEGAFLLNAQLEGTNLFAAGLERTDLTNARLESANLSFAQLDGTKFSGARMEEADLGGTQSVEAIFLGAHLKGVAFGSARLQEAEFIYAYLEGAFFKGAQLEGADFFGAHVEKAEFGSTHMAGTDFRAAYLEGTTFGYSLLRSADLRDAGGLTQQMLENVIGDEHTLLPDVPAPDTGQPFYVLSCWHPDNLPIFLGEFIRSATFQGIVDGESAFRRKWLCSNAKAVKKTGTPKAFGSNNPETK